MTPLFRLAAYHARRIPAQGAYEAMIVALLQATGGRRRDGSVVFKLRAVANHWG